MGIIIPTDQYFSEGQVNHQSDNVLKFDGLCTCLCLRPENRPSVFACFFFCFALWYVGGGGVGWGGGCNNVLSLCYHRCSSVSTLHVTLYTSVVLWWTHFMLRCTLLFYFGGHTSCYVAGRPVKTCCQIACLAKVQWSWHISRLGNGDTYMEMLMCVITLQRRSASWSDDGKESLALWRNATPSKNRNVFWRRSTCMFKLPLQ